MTARRPAFDRSGLLIQPPGLDAPEILRPDGAAIRRRLAAREISSGELVAASLDRIEALPAYNAVVSRRPRENILADADRADAALARGEPVGALHGLPIAIKDISGVAGLPTTRGSPLFADNVAAADDPFVARIRAAGAIFVGKTNIPEFGLGSHTYNPVFGPTRNAFDPALSAGGSSGGAAVALALRLLPIADGSDIGGSLRNPAAYNNVFGFRPSEGLVRNVPSVDPFYAQLATAGPMGRSVADLACLLTVMAGPDRFSPAGLDTAGPVPTTGAPRVAWLGDLGGHLAIEDGVLDLCASALGELGAAGWAIEPVAPQFDWEALWRAFVTLRQFSMMGRFRALHADPSRRARLNEPMRWEIASGLALGAEAVMVAADTRGAWGAAVRTLFERFDAIALPSAQVFPFPVAWDWPRSIRGREMDSYHRWMEVTVPGTMSGCPVVSVPAGFDGAGRPMGVQLIGKPRGDAGLLQLAARFERDAVAAAS